MKEFLGGLLSLAFFAIFLPSIIALFKPLPKLRLATRKQALGGIGLSFVLLVIIGLIAPPDEKSAPGKPEAKTETAATKPAAPKLTEQQENIVGFLRYVMMQNVSCKGDADFTQDQFDKIAAGQARPIDAYRAAETGLKSCRQAIDEFTRTDNMDGLAEQDRKAGRRAMDECAKAARDRKDAMALAQKVLDGDSRLATVSRYKDLRNSALAHDGLCRLSLMGLPEKAKIPDSEVDFVKF